MWFIALRRFLGCDHVRSYEYYLESIPDRCEFLAIECDSWENFLAGKCFGCKSEIVSLRQFYLSTILLFFSITSTEKFLFFLILKFCSSSHSDLSSSCEKFNFYVHINLLVNCNTGWYSDRFFNKINYFYKIRLKKKKLIKPIRIKEKQNLCDM